jgi:hypothetical protein
MILNNPNNSNMKHIPKILLIIFLVVFILQIIALIVLYIVPLIASAEAIPALDPSCWRKEDCEKAGGYIEADPACGGKGSEWYRCYPKTKEIQLEVKIPGTGKEGLIGKVTDVAQYIALMYKYTVGVGAILAVVMILWGGIVYLTAGGSPERIKSAKEYISNALVGLVLLYTSYLLLQTINPDLVKLKMPRVYMIRPIYAGAFYCNELEKEATKPLEFALAAESPDKPLTPLEQIKGYNISGAENTKCGRVYYEKSRGDQTCIGSDCTNWKTKVGDQEKICGTGEGKVGCVCKLDEKGAYYCASGIVTVDVTFDAKASDPPYIVSMVLMANCEGTSGARNRWRTDVKKSFEAKQKGKQFFIVEKSAEEIKNEVENNCRKGGGTFLGFFFLITVNENNGFDDDYIVGKNGNKPIMVGGNTDPMTHMLMEQVPKEEFIPLDDILNGKLNPFRITLNRNQFPTR